MGKQAKSAGRAAREERERKLLLKHKLSNRITTVRYGKESLSVGDYSGAIKRFKEYLSVIAEFKQVEDAYDLKVSHFDPKRDVTELLMISHIFFEMARIYDAIPKFQDDFKRCLDQFVNFSVNQPFQVVNSELVRKYLKKNVLKHPERFRLAHQQIFVKSKKCYVVTFCYGDNHLITHEYRKFKDWLLEYRWGQELVRFYYLTSSKYVPTWQNKPYMHVFGTYIVKPLLLLFSKTLLPLIIPKC
jgi:hypothetical protein